MSFFSDEEQLWEWKANITIGEEANQKAERQHKQQLLSEYKVIHHLKRVSFDTFALCNIIIIFF